MVYLFLGFFLIGLMDLLPLAEEKRKRELAVAGGIFIFALFLGVFYQLGIQVPSPVVALGNFFKEVLNLRY